MRFTKITKFDQLVESILNEKGKTPGKIKRHSNYIASGPQGLERGGSEVGNVMSKTNFIKRLEQNKKTGERSRDTGAAVASKAFDNLIKTFRFVLSQPVQASELKTAVEDYSNQYSLLTKTQKNLARELKPEKRAQLKSEVDQLAEELGQSAPSFYRTVIDTMDGIYRDIVNLINDDTSEITPEEGVSAEEYALSLYDPDKMKGNFERFVQAYSLGGEKNPIPLIISLFKTALIKNKEDDVVGDLPKLIDLLSNKGTQQKGNLSNSHAGRQKLELSQPVKADIVSKIKRAAKTGNYGPAKQAASEFPNIRTAIEELEKGERNEQSVTSAIFKGEL